MWENFSPDFFWVNLAGQRKRFFLWEKEGNEILKFTTSIFEVANFKNGLR